MDRRVTVAAGGAHLSPCARLDTKMIRILIADDHAIVRAGLQTLLSGLPDMEIAGEAGSGEEAIRMVRQGKCDVVLLDISMPDKNGVDTLTEIRRHRPELPVVMLSMHPESQYAVSLLRAGASGYVSKDGAPEELVLAIRTVMQGRRYVSATVGELLAADLDRNARIVRCTVLSRSASSRFSASSRRVSRCPGSPRRSFSA